MKVTAKKTIQVQLSVLRAPTGIGPLRSCAPSCSLRAWQSCGAWSVYIESLERGALHQHTDTQKKKITRSARKYWGMWVAGKVKIGWGTRRETLFFLPPALPPAAQLYHHVASTWCFALCFRPWTHTSTSISCRSI